MHERHTNRQRYFNEQALTTRKFVIPYISAVKPINEDSTILEIGCGEGGNLEPFLELNCKRIVGVDIGQGRIDNAKAFFSEIENGDRVEFICEDIYDSKDLGEFDVIIMRDVIEHIHDQEKFMRFVKKFLKPDGLFFLGFPPWYNPFGGHQQVCESKILSKLPYYHILPTPIYRRILKWGGESPERIEGLLEVKETGISIERFERILRDEHYTVKRRTHYFINPNYETKFGLKPRVAWKIVSGLNFFRNFFVTAMYYVISKDSEA